MRKMSKPRTHYSLLTLAALVLVVSATDQLPDLQQQQQQQQHTLNDPEDGWSPWSSWSLCSRSCDGGAAVQTRRCRHYTGCRGDSVRYQLCNTEPCPAGSKDFRAVQCSEYNGLPYEGTLYEWEPAGGADPCALTCRAVGGGPTVTLNPRVQDGTRCSPESFNLCINGRCQRVGCDHKLGSEKKVDQCGVCGGDGASCQQPSHSWETRANSACSATCGGGYQMLSAVCVETETGRRVDDEHCQPADRPITVILNCNDHACPTSWQTGEWGSCSVSCGSGYQLREVYCEEPRNISSVRVADHYCVLPRPPHRQPCNTYECPRWYDGIWSQCSATCGEGVQTRVVLCRDAQGRSSRLCHQGLRPAHTRPCRTGVTCPPPTTLAHPRHQPYTPPWWSEEQDALASEEGLAPPLIPRPQALIVDQQVPSEPTYMKGNWSSCSVTCGEGSRSRSVTCKIFLEFSRTVAVLPDDQCPGAKPPHSQRCVLPPCSHAMTRHEYPASEVSDAAHEHPIVSLEDAHDEDDSNGDQKIHETPFLPKLVDEDASFGRGKTLVQDIDLQVPKAQAYNEPHPGLHSYETPTDLQPASDPLLRYASEFDAHNQYDSYEVSRSKPQLESEHAEMNSIEIDMGGGEGGYPGSYQIEDESNIAHTYQWTTLGFGPCSASCLGGVQESMVKCVRKSDRKPVISQLCSTLVRPDIITRTCNDQPCPPRWNISEFGECSKTCGGGIQTREVKCIHEVTRGGTNTVEVPDSLCPQPPHRTQQHCNFMDCPPEWVPSRWSKCSAPCGGGGKRREVRCHQALANGRIEERPNRECPHRQPRSFRKCNQRGCQGERKEPKNSIIKSQVHQNYVQSKFMKRLTLKVGGTATVFRGVKVKVKCPVRRFDRSKITWWYEGHQVGKRGPIRTNNNGVLKIKEVQYPHAGVYICRANTSEANITLEVKPLPSSYPSSEELHQSSGSSVNEVSLHNFEDTTGTLRGYEWLPNKSTKLQGNGGRRRKGRRRSKTLKNKGRGGRRRKGNWESNWSPSDNKTSWTMHTTFRPILTFPSSSGTLGEGPFKENGNSLEDGLSGLETESKFSPDNSDPEKKRTISSRGGRHAASPRDEFGGLISHDLLRDATTTEHPLGTPEILGKGTRDSLEFEWQMTNWSECSQTCGFTSSSSGYQVRSIQCLVRVNNVSRPVDGALCVDAGLEAPVTIQRCGLTECPQWHFGEWSECESSRCFTLHYAFQRRDVVCRLHNGTVVSASQCDDRTRPRHRQECYNYQCSGVWRVGEWSECTAPCGGQGYRTRLLQCVWNGTKKAAGNACRELPRPEVVRWCDGEPCPDLSEEETKELSECRDRSKYCNIVKRMNMCRIPTYRKQCCRSCP
ncbi:protein madd-4-like isoform X9 [Cherax quadricarinatus]|uniref:protein madd-4-like isoform X9 n=1 Tax=Cherax quadricarinatus TaxID=27406 RepID=UPI00387E6596